MLMVGYIQIQHVEHLREVTTSEVGCGVMGMGNKGAVGLRLQFRDTSLCFVNCHLASDATQLERRNEDYREICGRLTFPVKESLPNRFARALLTSDWATAISGAGFFDAGVQAYSVFDCE